MKTWLARSAAAVMIVGSLSVAPRAHAEDMNFRLVPISDRDTCRGRCPEVIAAEGEIVDDTPETFLAFLQRSASDRRVRAVVLFNSPGGRVVASMRLGLQLRAIGAAAIVAKAAPAEYGAPARIASGRCFSACVYALMGGKKRVIPRLSEVGIHRMFTVESGGRDPSGDQLGTRRTSVHGEIVSQLSAYSGVMGVSRQLVANAERISSDTIHVLTPGEIARWRLGSPRL